MGYKIKIPKPLHLSIGRGQWFLCLEEEAFELKINFNTEQDEVRSSASFDSKELLALYQVAKETAIKQGIVSSSDYFSIEFRTSSKDYTPSEEYLTWVFFQALAHSYYKNIPLNRHYELLKSLDFKHDDQSLRASFLGGLSVLSQNWSIEGDLRIPFSPMLKLARIKNLNFGAAEKDMSYREACLQQGLILSKVSLISKGLIPLESPDGSKTIHPSENMLGVLALKEDFDLIVFSDSNSCDSFLQRAPKEWEAQLVNICANGILKF